MTYWDMSALLKLYVSEPDSPYFFDRAAGTEDEILSSAIVTTEVLCAVYRKECAGDLKKDGAKAVFLKFLADADAGRIITAPYGRDVVEQTAKLVRLAFGRRRPPAIRSLDAIHVASALTIKAKAVVSTDSHLREVAAAAGLKLVP